MTEKKIATELVLDYICDDFWALPVYKDQNNRFWKDIELGESKTPDLYSVSNNDFDGEPNCPIQTPFTIRTPKPPSDKSFQYQMLSRLQSDCEYFLGYGNYSEKRLWASNVKNQIKEMKKLWNGFEKHEKPEWLTMEQINQYEKDMLIALREKENNND
ncbi:hypothetical protein M2146_001188 [Lachnospiraceae bacterium PF1-22]